MNDKRIALVTGANKGIGFETARQLAAHGMTVLVGARDAARGEAAAEKLRGEGCDARFVPIDVVDAESIAAAARAIERDPGRLDVLVNNAGIVLGRGKPSETSLDDVRRVFEVNVLGVVAVTNAMLPLLRRGRSPRIVNVSSGMGSLTNHSDPTWEYTGFNAIAYPTSKAALNMVTVQYAKELAAAGIQVNAADPGYTATDFNQHRGTQTVEEGTRAIVKLALLDDSSPVQIARGHVRSPVLQGPTGGFFDMHGRVAW